MKNQIDYQTIEFKSAFDIELDSITIPLPINSILKGVNVRKNTQLASFAETRAVQVMVELIQVDGNSNIRLRHQLMRGIIYASEDGSDNIVYEKTLNGIYDIPIQKEGIALKVTVYNAINSSSTIQINYMVKNLEGGI